MFLFVISTVEILPRAQVLSTVLSNIRVGELCGGQKFDTSYLQHVLLEYTLTPRLSGKTS